MTSKIPEVWEDERSNQEKEFTNKFIEKLSDVNFETILKRSYPCLHQNKNILTIAINGIPYDPEQFTGFTFPGTFINYFPPGSEPHKTEEFYIERIKKISLQNIIKEIDEIVEKHGGKVVFVYHSYGTYFASAYSAFYPKKVVGLVQFGCVPISTYPFLQYYYFETQQQNFKLDIDADWQRYKQYNKINILRLMENKYTYYAFRRILLQIVNNVFKWRRNLPDILKVIAFGRSDKIFMPELLNQTAYHYAFGNQGGPKLEKGEYQQKLTRIFKEITGITTDNLQKHFIFSFLKTGHGVHLKKKKQLQQILNLYFALILSDYPEGASM